MGKKIYISLIVLAYLALTVVFVVLPRPEYSVLEKRDLKKFPEFSTERLVKGDFTNEINEWFSDSEPFRDQFMRISMLVDEAMQLRVSDDQVKFHAAEKPMAEEDEVEEDAEPAPAQQAAAQAVADSAASPNGVAGANAAVLPTNGDLSASMLPNDTAENRGLTQFNNEKTIDENAKIANAGIIVIGEGPTTRAMMAYGGGPKTGTKYASVVNRYKRVFGNKVNVYSMVIPTAIEYYCPAKARKCTHRQMPTIENIHSLLSDSVKAVNIYDVLAQHVDEDIFLRTDHHWSPLAGFYAAREFAKVANVPFKDLSSYTERRVRGYVGSMYGMSKDIAVKKNPEVFVYHVPNDVKYTTTYMNYKLDSKYRIVGETTPFKGAYFMHFKDGNGGAYCTFMGGDCKITKIQTSTNNGRRLMLLKDSFGNVLPGYLFYSFEEIHIIDFRYFTKNIIKYVNENKVTDILFANNIFLLASPANCRNFERFLVQ